MYCDFYGLSEQPFNLTPDSKFLFFSRRHQDAFAALMYGVQERKGFICLSGEIGSGKTTLYRTLLAQLDREKFKIAVILNSYLSDLELLKTINQEYGLPHDSNSKKELLDHLNHFLVEQFSRGVNCVLIVDEAQNLRPETLEQVRMISNLETETDKLIQIILVGQPELRRTLALPELEQLNQRVTVRHHVTPLSESEVAQYINHRLGVAGAQVNIEFTPQALRLIYHYTRGVPRRINVICDRCLLLGYATSRFDIDGQMVQQAVDEIRGEDRRALDEEDLAAAPPPSPGKGRVGRGLRAAALPLLLLGIVAGGVWLGATLKDISQRDKYGGSRFARPTDAAGKTAPVEFEEDTPAPTPRGARKKGATPTPASAAAAPKETPTPAPSPSPQGSPTPFRYEPWERDRDKIVRVQRPDHTNAAAHVNLLQVWGVEVDLSTFTSADPDQVARFDLTAMVRQQHFITFRTSTLTEALKLDLPMVVYFSKDAKDLPLHAAIVRVQGELFTIADPIRGLRTLKRKEIEPHVLELAVLYRDPAGLTGLGPGSGGEAVAELQRTMIQAGVTIADVDGKFGDRLGEKLRKLQTDRKLPQSGRVDGMTAAYLCAIRDLERPRLSRP